MSESVGNRSATNLDVASAFVPLNLYFPFFKGQSPMSPAPMKTGSSAGLVVEEAGKSDVKEDVGVALNESINRDVMSSMSRIVFIMFLLDRHLVKLQDTQSQTTLRLCPNHSYDVHF
jgi:hypothetical protein